MCFVSRDVIFNEMQMAKLVNWKTVNEGSLLEEKFQLEVEFHKSHHKDDQNGQPRTNAEID